MVIYITVAHIDTPPAKIKTIINYSIVFCIIWPIINTAIVAFADVVTLLPLHAHQQTHSCLCFIFATEQIVRSQ
jgi:hypothetical protein